MMPWLRLFRAEAVGLSRRLADAARANPLLAALAPVAGGVVLLIAVEGGAQLSAVLMGVPGGQAVIPSLMVALLALGVVIGFVLATQAPTFDALDAQVRTVPISGMAAFIGVTGLPLLIAWTLLSLPVLPFGWSLFGGLGIAGAPAWGAVLFIAQVSAAILGGTLLELLRRRADVSGVGTALLGVIVAIALPRLAAGAGAEAWWWLAALFPGTESSSPVAALGITVATMLAVGVAWTSLGRRGLRRFRSGGTVSSQPIFGGPMKAVVGWLTLTALRHRAVQVQSAIAIGAGLLAAILLTMVLGPEALALVPVLLMLVILIAASPALLLSHPLALGSWLMRTASTGRKRIGVAWWVGLTLLSVLITAMASAPLALTQPSFASFWLVAIVAMAALPAAVGRLLPWRPLSMFRQLAITLAMTGLYAVGVVAASEAAGRLAGNSVLATAGVLLVLALVWLASLAACATAEWKSS